LQKELDEILNPKPVEEGEEGAAQVNAGKKKKKAQDPKQLQAKIDELKKEIEKQNEPAKDGWILIDFPSTYAQAKLLETALSGYVTPTEQEPIDREK
jgi:adenylate kinase family enzyme